MQLDKTRIVVRERSVFETLDLALHVLRMHFQPVCLLMLVGAAPWLLVNFLLIAWMLPSDLDPADLFFQANYYPRYLWTMAVLVSIEAPWASAFATVYLGKALFVEHPSMKEVFHEVGSMTPRLLWYHGFLRGVVPAICLVWIIDREQGFTGTELLLMLLLIAVLLRRATAPFLNEIVLLERNPIRASDPQTITVQRRSTMLHGPASGNLVNFAFVGSLYAAMMAVGFTVVLYVLYGIAVNNWEPRREFPLLAWPVALWMTATFMTVARFLSYLDLRIRFEGWEVELRMRAEAKRLLESL